MSASFSFEGDFTKDDDVRFFTFSVAAPSVVTIRTHSYAGGTNFIGNLIAPDGFNPILSVFTGLMDPNGVQVGVNNDAGCPDVNADPDTGACWDSGLILGLVPGVYTVSLSQDDNTPFGPTLGDGFSRQGQGNFTGPTFLGMPGSFIDANLDQRTPHWSVDILDVESATAVPEPSSILLCASGALVFFVARKRSAKRQL